MEVDPALGLVVLVLLLGLVVWLMRRRREYGSSSVEKGPRIVCLKGPNQGEAFYFTGSSLSFGRAPDQNDVVLDGTLISRQHAKLILTAKGPVLQDMDSTNGTWLNGRRVVQELLAPEQPFQIGPYVFAFYTSIRPLPSPSAVHTPAQAAPQAISSSVAQNLDIGQYERVRLLGEGGAAFVYLVRHRRSGDLMALKILKHETAEYFKQKFEGEARIGMTIQHHHIVSVFSTGQSGGVPYILMEYMPGGSLRDLMVRGGLTTTQIVKILGQVCEALQFAHSNNPAVFHRDIKPENILFDEKGRVKLADFGIARIAGQKTLTMAGMIVGTPEYMSVEQAKGAQIDGRSDQYSLGIVLYEMLTGRVPFIGTSLEVVGKHLGDNPVPPRHLNPRVDGNMERVVLKALNKNPSQRYREIRHLADALGYRASSGPGIPIISKADSAQPPRRRRSQIVEVGTGRVLELTQPEVILGRDMAGHNTVSSTHARIRQAGGQTTIEDLNSRNGTFVNGYRLPPQTAYQLNNGDVIQLGPLVRYQYSMQ